MYFQVDQSFGTIPSFLGLCDDGCDDADLSTSYGIPACLSCLEAIATHFIPSREPTYSRGTLRLRIDSNGAVGRIGKSEEASESLKEG